jgi:mannose-1-phosphate guanylyltransferase/mannose-6-phosphate isomerase
MADGSYQIAQFVEKPDLATAQKFIKSGGYYWNSGMFCFPRTLFLEELALCAPDIYHATQKAAKTLQADGYFFRTDSELFAHIPDQSLDYALMEHTKRGFMLPLAIQWSDIGSWESLFNYEQKDPQGNVHVGDVLSIDNKNCYLRSEQRLLAAVGLENVIVVQTGDCVLVVDKQQSQKVKEIVKQLKHHHRPEAVRHLVQYHPWGTTTLLNAGDGFTINRVDINPMQRLSLHHHEHRSEHWLVLSGEAKVTINDVEKIYEKGTSFFIPLQSRHSIANTTDAIISLVEVQAGHFVAEDIYRYE